MNTEKIFFLSCFARDKNIGKEYNARIAELPEDAWICLMDQDVIFLSPFMGERIHRVVEQNPKVDLIGCMTNRLLDENQLHQRQFSPDPNILHHAQITEERWQQYGTRVKPAQSIAGMFMLFKKHTWQQVKFQEHSLRFDILFCMQARKKAIQSAWPKVCIFFTFTDYGAKPPIQTFNIYKHDPGTTR